LEKKNMKMLKGVTKGLPQTGLQGGAGVGVFYLHRTLSSKIAFAQNHPLTIPVGFIVLGHVLKKSKKLGSIGAALVGAGGYAGAQVFELKKAAAAASTPSTPAAGTTAGVDDDNDTGMLVPAHEVGMLLQSSNIGEMEPDNQGSYSDAYYMASA
jgi:hypothetical protein